MASFHFELVSPEKLLFSGDVESVVASSVEGEFTVLKDHAPIMASLKPGVVSVADAAGKTSRLFVRGGFVEVSTKGMTILAEQAIPLEELDAGKIDTQIRDAEEGLADAATGEAKRAAAEQLDQLRELRATLNI